MIWVAYVVFVTAASVAAAWATWPHGAHWRRVVGFALTGFFATLALNALLFALGVVA